MTASHDPAGPSLPIKLDATSNGEFVPVPLTAVARAARDRVQHSKLQSLNDPDPAFLTYGPRSRREFLAFRALHGELA